MYNSRHAALAVLGYWQGLQPVVEWRAGGNGCVLHGDFGAALRFKLGEQYANGAVLTTWLGADAMRQGRGVCVVAALMLTALVLLRAARAGHAAFDQRDAHYMMLRRACMHI
jgi:hypothetical protein